MDLLSPVRSTCWPSDSGCGDNDISKFVRCVDGRDPKVHEVWIWGDDGITPKVHPTVWVDVDPWITPYVETDYFTETGSTTAIFVQKCINGSFDFWGVADPLRTRSPYWIENILCPSPRWGVVGNVKILNWGSQTVSRYGGVDFLWHGTVPACPAYLSWTPKMRAPLRTAFLTISFDSTVWRASKVSQISGTSSVISLSIGWTSPGMIFGTNRLLNDFSGKFMLVV